MKVTKYGSSTVLIESSDVHILCDPWLIDGALYGGWCNYPPINVEEIDFARIDYIYISHVHQDHFDPRTMELIDKKTPVLIHKFHKKYLKANIERLGFSVIELDNGKPFLLKEKVEVSIFAADDCDPSICGRMFGCITGDIDGSMQLDSLCVIDDGKHVLVNTNDCPYRIAQSTLKRVKSLYPEIDFALVGYTSASLFPHCMMDYSESEMAQGREKARMIGLTSGLSILKVLEPKYYMPFAGTYIIGGSNYKKNENLSLPEITDATAFFQEDGDIVRAGCQPVLLNFNETFDLATGEASAPYIKIDPVERSRYIKGVASKFKYTFEGDDKPSNEELLALFKGSCPRLKRKQEELGKYEDINLVFDVCENKYVCVNLIDTTAELVDEIESLDSYYRFKLDTRLLRLSLQGPRYANWNNIESSGILGFSRKPDEYRMDVHVLMNALHV